MVTGVNNFVPERLIQARNARGLMSVSLSEMIGVSPTTISLYEKGTQKPKQSTIELMGKVLNLPVSFFLSTIEIDKPDKLFYRSMSSATKSSRLRAESKHEWALDIIDYLGEYFEFPELNLPDFELDSNFEDITENLIENIAESLRELWRLSDRPIPNLIQLLERNGIFVYRTHMNSEKLDAFSDYRLPNPIIALSSQKNNYYRSRFDAAHELGHLILHKNVDKRSLNKSSDFKLIEDQANYFASVFLLPQSSYSKDLWSPSLDAFRSLKSIWNVSIGMQIFRAKSLQFIDEKEEKRLWINRTRRGWNKSEPLDNSTEPEVPSLIRKSFKMLMDENVKTKAEISTDLRLKPSDIESIFELPKGFLSQDNESNGVRLKTTGAKILEFPKK